MFGFSCKSVISLLTVLCVTSIAMAEVKPPVATAIPVTLEGVGGKRVDPYFWMRDKTNPKVISYLNAENAYAEQVMEPQKPLRKRLVAEMKKRIKDDDSTYPYLEQGYLYYTRTVKGREFPIYCRKSAGQKNAPEQILIDVNELAKGHDYARVSSIDVNEATQTLAYSLDLKGDRILTIHFKDLKTGKMLNDTIDDVAMGPVWANDGKTVFYVKNEPKTLRSRWVYRRQIGQPQETLVYDEQDEKFDVSVKRSLTRKYIVISSASKTSSEARFGLSDEPAAPFRLFQARQPNVEYSIEDGGDRFYVLTNWNAVNFRVLETPLDQTSMSGWKEVVPHSPDAFIQYMIVFKTHLALEERRDGLPALRMIDRADLTSTPVRFKEKAYFVALEANFEYDSPFVRFSYQSLTTPPSIIDFQLADSTQLIREQKKIPGGFESARYETDRISAKASDGTKIPISLVYRKSLKRGSQTPILLHGYGSYGYSAEAYFSANLISLLDRGFVFALAHVRGGSEMGRSWYLDGKLLKKKNTFTDFIAVAEHLVKTGYTSPEHLYAVGGSAGGLLMGAVLNLRPDLFRGIVAGVPFVDVVTTMLDASLPLTTGEYEEWGNPNEKASYDYMLSYSPYDNLKPGSYPNLYVHSGLNDTQVGFWEPAKWVTKIRSLNRSGNLVLFKTEMGAGHSGKNGRYSALDQQAMEYAFLLRLEGKR